VAAACSDPAATSTPTDTQAPPSDAAVEVDVATVGDVAADATRKPGAAESTQGGDTAAAPLDSATQVDAAGNGDTADASQYPPCPDVFSCKVHGLCWLVGGKCVALTDADCTLSSGSSEAGHRHAVAGKCVAKGEADRSHLFGACSTNGFCAFKDGTCVIPASGCGFNKVLFDGHCVEEAAAGEIGVPCEKRKFQCGRDGRCTNVNGVCVNTNDAACKKSLNCKQEGACVNKGEKCVAPDQAACEASEYCPGLGNCSYYAGECLPMGDADCAKSKEKCDPDCGFDKYPPCPEEPCTPYLKDRTYIGVACWGDKGYCVVHSDGYCSPTK
jgi:hypothetical protein